LEILPWYDEFLMVILPIDIIIGIILGTRHILKFKKNKSRVTLAWALGFYLVGINFFLVYILKYVFGMSTTTWNYEDLFNLTAILSIASSLAYSSAYIKLFSVASKNQKFHKIIKKFSTILYFSTVTYLILASFPLLLPIKIGAYIVRGVAVYVIIIFLLFGVKYKDFRISCIGISFLFATSGGMMMSIGYGTMIGIVGHLLQFVFYIFIIIGLISARKYVKRE